MTNGCDEIDEVKGYSVSEGVVMMLLIIVFLVRTVGYPCARRPMTNMLTNMRVYLYESFLGSRVWQGRSNEHHIALNRISRVIISRDYTIS